MHANLGIGPILLASVLKTYTMIRILSTSTLVQSQLEITCGIKKLFTALLCLLSIHSAVFTVALVTHPPSVSRRIQNNIFFHDGIVTKEYRDETWTATSSTYFINRLSRKGMMGKGSFPDLSFFPSISPMPSVLSKRKGKGKGSSSKGKGKGMTGKSDKFPKGDDCLQPKNSKKSKYSKKHMGKGKKGKKKGKGQKTCSPTVPTSNPANGVTAAPSLLPGVTSSPLTPTTTIPIDAVAPSFPPETTLAPTITPGLTATPSLPPGTIVTPTNPPIATPAPSLPPGTISLPPGTTATPIPPGTTAVPTISPGLTATPSLLPGNTATPTANPPNTPLPSLPPGTTAVPTISPGLTAAPSLLPGTTTTPTATSPNTLAPLLPPGTTAVPTISPGLTAAPSLLPGTTTTPTATPPGTTAAPTISPGFTATPIGPPETPTNPPVDTPVPSLPPGTTVTPTITPGVTEAPSLPPGVTLTPTILPSARLPSDLPSIMPSTNGGTPSPTSAPAMNPGVPAAPSLPPEGTLAPTITPGVTAAPSLPPVGTLAPTILPSARLPSDLPSIMPSANGGMPVPVTTSMPTPRPVGSAPTFAPSNIVPTGTQSPITTSIPAPSAASSVPTASPFSFVPATPFRLTYMLTESREPNEFEYAMAADVALLHIEAVLRDQFSNAIGIEVNVFDGMITAMGFDPVTIDFNVKVSFTNDASFVPSTADIDSLIEVALLPPESDGLIADYNALPADSPFSTTQSVAYQALSSIIREGLKVVSPKADQKQSITRTETSLVAAILFLVLLTSIVFIIWLRSRKNRYSKCCERAKTKSDLLAIMPAYSYSDGRSSNLMQFKDDNSTGKSENSHRFKARSTTSSMSSRTSSSVSIRAV